MKRFYSLEDKRIPRLTRLIDLLVHLSVLKDEGDSLVFIKKTKQESKTSSIGEIKQFEKTVMPVKKILEISDEKISFDNQISFLFEISPEIDEEKLRKSIRVILEEIKGINNGE